MRLICTLILSFFLVSPTAAQDTQSKTLTLDGADFAFQVSKTPDGKDFGYFVPSSRWPSSSDLSTLIYVCWENYRSEFNREHVMVQEAITSTWEKHSKIKFRG